MKTNMTINEALQQIPWKKAEYFRYRFPDCRFFDSEQITEEQFLNRVGLKTLATFERWERTAEWKSLVALYLESQFANNLLTIFQVVKNRALEGEDKAVKLYLQLGKEIEQLAKAAPSMLAKKKGKEQDDDEDDLIIS